MGIRRDSTQSWRGVDQGNARVAPNWKGDCDVKVVGMWSKWDENVFFVGRG